VVAAREARGARSPRSIRPLPARECRRGAARVGCSRREYGFERARCFVR
jgi:hypothetical protein